MNTIGDQGPVQLPEVLKTQNLEVHNKQAANAIKGILNEFQMNLRDVYGSASKDDKLKLLKNVTNKIMELSNKVDEAESKATRKEVKLEYKNLEEFTKKAKDIANKFIKNENLIDREFKKAEKTSLLNGKVIEEMGLTDLDPVQKKRVDDILDGFRKTHKDKNEFSKEIPLYARGISMITQENVNKAPTAAKQISLYLRNIIKEANK